MNFTPPLPDKKYSVIYADPPWKYPKGELMGGSKIDNHYLTLSSEQLSDLPISSITKNDCLLFIWTTSIAFPTALKVGDSWGFKYVTVGFVWDKVNPVYGRYTFITMRVLLDIQTWQNPTTAWQAKHTAILISQAWQSFCKTD